MTLIKKCRKCGYVDLAQSKCKVTGRKVDLDKDQCSTFNDDPRRCDVCHGLMVTGGIVEEVNGNYYTLCPKCSDAISECFGCEHSETCVFESDPSPLPKMVMRQVQQGNAIMQTQMRNPDREKCTCALYCKCWDGETKSCNREFNICPEHKLNNRLFPSRLESESV